jgi:AsmA protein
MPTSGKVRILKWLAIVVVLLLVIAVALPFVLDANQFRPQIESKLSSALGRDVKLGNLKLSLLSGSVRVEDINVADNPAFSRSPFVNAKSLQVSIELKPLIFDKSIRIQGITLDHPTITLVSSKSGQWNFSDLGSSHSGQKPTDAGKSSDFSGTGVSIKQLEIVDGQVTLIHADQNHKPSIYKNVNLKVKDLSYTTEFPFSLTASLPGEGALKLEGKAGPFNNGDMTLTPLAAELDVKHFDLHSSGFSEAESGLMGVLDFSGNLQSDGSEVKGKGKASANKLRIVSTGSPSNGTVSLNYAVDYNMLLRTGNLQDTDVEIGKAVAHLSGSFEMKESSLNLKLMLHGTDMPVDDLTGMFPAFGIKLPKGAALKGGILNADVTAEGPVDKLFSAGNVKIAGTSLTGFDLSGKMATLAPLAGLKPNEDTKIEKLASTLNLSPEGIQVNNLVLILPSLGELSGNGRVAADESLDFMMKATLKPAGGIGAELATLIKGNSLTVPFFIRGTASDPKFVPDVKKAAGGLLGSVIGQGSKDSQTNTGATLQNTIRSLFKKK